MTGVKFQFQRLGLPGCLKLLGIPPDQRICRGGTRSFLLSGKHENRSEYRLYDLLDAAKAAHAQMSAQLQVDLPENQKLKVWLDALLDRVQKLLRRRGIEYV